MPRFYIDTSDQELFIRDQNGHEFDHVEAAKTAALQALPGMARDAFLAGGENRSFLAVVRDEQGRTLVQATMSVGVIWMTNDR